MYRKCIDKLEIDMGQLRKRVIILENNSKMSHKAIISYDEESDHQI